jgi:hypothetical protein
VEDELQLLATALERFALFLRRHGEAHWAEWVQGDSERLRARDYTGVEHFLSAFGGMGSLNDLVFPDRGGLEYHALWQARDDVAEPAYALAKAIQRRHAHREAAP